MAAPIPLAASGADRGIAAADLEPQIITTASIEPALCMRLASEGQHRHCERGPQPERNLHARPIESESSVSLPRTYVNALACGCAGTDRQWLPHKILLE